MSCALPLIWACGVSVCSNTLVCDTQEEAKRLAFGTERHKVGCPRTKYCHAISSAALYLYFAQDHVQ